jgi:hypothetical protein
MTRHYVYRHYDAVGRPLYVGCSKQPQLRFKQHMHHSTWWAQLVTYSKLTVHPTRTDGIEVEEQEIARLEPLHNGEVHLMDTTEWPVEKFVAHGVALANSQFNETVNPKSALGKLAVRFEKRFGRDLFEVMGPVRSGFRKLYPDEYRPARILHLEGPYEHLEAPELPPVLRAVS